MNGVVPDRHEQLATVGCVNFATIWGDKRANLAKIIATIERAADLGVDILAFPELALSGYECGPGRCGMHHEIAETIPGPATDEIAALVRRYGMYVTFGMPERDAADPSVHYISCPFIGPEGLIGTYRKLHIAPPPIFTEQGCFHGGSALPVFETRFGPIGVQICADFWVMPELSRILMLKGARLILNCSGSFSAPDRPYYLRQMTGARATENLVFTGTANLTGTERTRSYYGHSTIAGPSFPRFVQILAQGEEREEIVMATVNFRALEYFRSMIRLPELRREDVILRELRELKEARGRAP